VFTKIATLGDGLGNKEVGIKAGVHEAVMVPENFPELPQKGIFARPTKGNDHEF
jgi:hypothetical protein